MILIVGSSNDDILYFESVMKNRKEVTILGQFTAYDGEIFNQKVLLLKDIFSSYVSSAVISHVIEKYLAILVIYVGEVQSFTDTLEIGDICVCRQTVFGDVNVSDVVPKVAKGEIPGFQTSLFTNNEITEALKNALQIRSSSRPRNVTFVNSNAHPETVDKIDAIVSNDMILGLSGEVAITSELGGVALASKLHDVPYAAVGVVGRKIGIQPSIDDYVKVLDQYANVGKAVTSVIGDIGRTDVIK